MKVFYLDIHHCSVEETHDYSAVGSASIFKSLVIKTPVPTKQNANIVLKGLLKKVLILERWFLGICIVIIFTA